MTHRLTSQFQTIIISFHFIIFYLFCNSYLLTGTVTSHKQFSMCSLSKIIWNISNLEKLIEIDQSFLSGLTQCGLITDHSLTTLQRKFGDDPRKFAYKLLGRVDESSSDASVRLAELLVSLHNEEAARLLDPGRWRLTGSDGCVSSKIGKKKNLPEADGVPPSLVVKVIPAQQLIQGEDIYPLAGGVRRGLALVVNNETFSEPQYETRHGARRDVQNVTSLLSQMGFSVTTKENLTRAEMLQTFLDFSTNEKHGDIMVVGRFCNVTQTDSRNVLSLSGDVSRPRGHEDRQFGWEAARLLQGHPEVCIDTKYDDTLKVPL